MIGHTFYGRVKSFFFPVRPRIVKAGIFRIIFTFFITELQNLLKDRFLTYIFIVIGKIFIIINVIINVPRSLIFRFRRRIPK